MTNISNQVAQLLSEEWKSLPISVDERQFKHFELLPVYLRDFIWNQVQHRFRSQLNASNAHWVQWDDSSVRTKWESFITAAMETIEVPREELVEIGQEFVQTWIPILVQPNEQLVDFLYGDKVELEAHELEKRCEELLFFPELKRLLPRYLERKELHVLSKVRASQIIQQLLSKLTESYDWGRWEQELETLYQLCMSVELPKSLLADYFDDRSKNEWAIKLRGEGDLRVNEVIGLIKKKTLVEVEPEPTPEPESVDDEDSLFNRPFLETEEVEDEIEENDDDDEDDESSLFNAEEVAESTLFIAPEEEEDEEELHPDSLASMFMQNNKSEYEGSTTSDTEQDDFASIFGESSGTEKSLETDNTTFDESDTDSLFESDSLFDDDTLTEEDSPFETTQDSPFETTEDSFFEQDVEEQPEDLSEPVAPVSSNESEGGLAKALKKNQKKYIKKLFGGSEADYKEVIETLEGKFVWKNVIKCLQTEIIPTYDIDMTSKIMVQFTDELQKYFTD
jgi:hypothetical protein